MWIFTTRGFISIVQHNSMKACFQVKSREPGPLEHFWPEQEIRVIDWADYRYRIDIGKDEVYPVLNKLLDSIDYTGFKNNCEGQDYYRALTRIWSVMFAFQESMEDSEA